MTLAIRQINVLSIYNFTLNDPRQVLTYSTQHGTNILTGWYVCQPLTHSVETHRRKWRKSVLSGRLTIYNLMEYMLRLDRKQPYLSIQRSSFSLKWLWFAFFYLIAVQTLSNICLFQTIYYYYRLSTYIIKINTSAYM